MRVKAENFASISIYNNSGSELNKDTHISQGLFTYKSQHQLNKSNKALHLRPLSSLTSKDLLGRESPVHMLVQLAAAWCTAGPCRALRGAAWPRLRAPGA